MGRSLSDLLGSSLAQPLLNHAEQLLRPKVDAGLGYLIGEEPAQVCRTYFLDVGDAKAVIARARAARERAGTLSGTAIGGDTSAPARDVLACFGDDAGLHWSVLADRLAQRWPDRWAGLTGGAISAQLRAFDVRSVQVKMAGQNLPGCRRAALEALPK